MAMKHMRLFSRPTNRSRLRMRIGKIYFTWRRCFQWIFDKSIKYTTTIGKSMLPYTVAAHKTPLYRQLRNVDMWLQENKVNNLKLAAAKIDGLILSPGETFSFWRLVGKPTKAKGFLEGMVLINGTFIAGIGGGLCQLSNLIYWMTLHTPLTVTERWRHNYDVFPDADRTQPFGSGATVAYNYVDLQIRNDTQKQYQLSVSVEDSYLQGKWRCEEPCPYRYEVYESKHLITHEVWGGYMRHNVIRRKVFDMNNNQIRDEFIAENHAVIMYQSMLTSD